jgi:hypothetical protein
MSALIDFVDFGYGKGGGYSLCKKLGGKTGFSIDIRYEVASRARKENRFCIACDATLCNFPPNSIKFSTMIHFLEHLPNIEVAGSFIKNCGNFITNFIVIEGPFFDFDEKLKNQGLKFYWSDWLGHPLHIKTKELLELIKTSGFSNYLTFVSGKVVSSQDPSIHPLMSPNDQFMYDAKIHPPKSNVIFDKPLYKNFMIYAFKEAPSLEFAKKLLTIRKKFLPVEIIF